MSIDSEKWSKEQVNNLLKKRIGFTNDEDIEPYRNEYLNIIKQPSEKEFYYSMMSWWNDGNAPCYDSGLAKNWSDENENNI